jgi:hypothetical protein
MAGSMTVELAIVLAIWVGLSWAGGAIWSNKGGPFAFGFFAVFLGSLLAGLGGLIALFALSMGTPSNSSGAGESGSGRLQPASASQGAARPTSVAASPGDEGTPVLHRECPHCREAMRRDASVCAHCQRESPAWSYESGVWWSDNPAGERVWLDEYTDIWKAGSPSELFDPRLFKPPKMSRVGDHYFYEAGPMRLGIGVKQSGDMEVCVWDDELLGPRKQYPATNEGWQQALDEYDLDWRLIRHRR